MKLRFTTRAVQQIDEALAYVAERSPQGAASIEKRLSAMIAAVQLYPLIGRKMPLPGVRRMYLEPYPYAIDYFVGNDVIVVQRFRHAARRPT